MRLLAVVDMWRVYVYARYPVGSDHWLVVVVWYVFFLALFVPWFFKETYEIYDPYAV